jgi:hypothetical protein
MTANNIMGLSLHESDQSRYNNLDNSHDKKDQHFQSKNWLTLGNSHVIVSVSRNHDSVVIFLDKTRLKHTVQSIGGSLVRINLLLGSLQLDLKLFELFKFLIKFLMLDKILILLIFNLLFRPSSFTANFHKKIACSLAL